MNSIEFLISKALTDSNISHGKFVLINNVLKEFYVKCRKNTGSKNVQCVIKKQEVRGLLSKLTAIKVPILSVLAIANILFYKYKTNAIVNKILLAGDKFMPKMHLKQPEFTYRTCGPFTKNK